MAMHPLALAFAERELGTSCLLSAMLAINLHPGETVQDWHHDDGHLEVPLPRAPFGVSTFWAIDAMTEENGATEIIPGSHKWAKSEVSDPDLHAYERGEMDVNHDPKPHPDAVEGDYARGLLHGGQRYLVAPGWVQQIIQ